MRFLHEAKNPNLLLTGNRVSTQAEADRLKPVVLNLGMENKGLKRRP
jgi:hypothetical protein